MKTLLITGCIRSGLSVTMQMLYKGGYPCAGEWPAFENYDIGKIPFDQCRGKVIKVVDTQIQFPPKDEYYVIRLRRNLKQQVKSQIKLARLFGLPIDYLANRKILEQSLKTDYRKIDDWAQRQKGFIIIDFEEILANPDKVADKLIDFTGIKLNKQEMIKAVIKRDSSCYNGMLEIDLINNSKI